MMEMQVPTYDPERVRPETGGCPRCHDRGWIVVPDGGAGTARRCDCRDRDRGPLLLAQAGIPERYRRCTLSNFDTTAPDSAMRDSLLGARQTSEQFVKEFFDRGENRYRSKGLIYVGPPGTGKTHLAAAVLAEVIRKWGARGRFVDFTSLLHQIRGTFDATGEETQRQVVDPVIAAEVLVLDELGAQKTTEWVQDVLYLIINTRYTQRLPTLFTTNFLLERPGAGSNGPPGPRSPFPGSDAQVAEHWDDRPAGSRGERLRGQPAPFDPATLLASRLSPLLLSRLFEMAEPIRLGSRDYRREIKKYQHRIGG